MLPSAPPPALSLPNEFIGHISQYTTGTREPEQIVAHVRAVFGVIRQRASFEQSIRFLEILPIPLKVVFLSDWHIVPHAPSPLRSVDEWADEMLRLAYQPALKDREEAQGILLAVFRMLDEHVGGDTLRRGMSFVAPEVLSQLLDHPEHYHYADACSCLS